MIKAMLTTVDNPHDPFTEWDAWYSFDTRMGYHTTSFLARVVITSEDLSESDENLAITNGIDEIVRENVIGIYRKVTKEFARTATNFDTFEW